jgi:hypothetical protein
MSLVKLAWDSKMDEFENIFKSKTLKQMQPYKYFEDKHKQKAKEWIKYYQLEPNDPLTHTVGKEQRKWTNAVYDRYNKYKSHIRNRNMKRGLAGLAAVTVLGGIVKNSLNKDKK